MIGDFSILESSDDTLEVGFLAIGTVFRDDAFLSKTVEERHRFTECGFGLFLFAFFGERFDFLNGSAATILLRGILAIGFCAGPIALDLGLDIWHVYCSFFYNARHILALRLTNRNKYLWFLRVSLFAMDEVKLGFGEFIDAAKNPIHGFWDDGSEFSIQSLAHLDVAHGVAA